MAKSAPSTRRRFLKNTATSAPLLILPSGTLRGEDRKPNSKLNVAFIGMGGRMQGHVGKTLALQHNVVAFCDVDKRQADASKKRHGEPVAKTKVYEDYRRLLDKEKSVDAVVISTPDHWHAPICRAAIAVGKHVFCEKPLTHTLAEARELRELSRDSKVVTQTGNQGSASGNIRRSMELIRAGFFGEITDIHVWHPKHGSPYGDSRPQGRDAVPQGLNWDFWCGPAPLRPYKKDIYHPAKWRAWYDFGNGALGDFCCHSFNLPLRALDLDYPETISVSGERLGLETFARACTVRYKFPARGKRGPVELNFYTGGDEPPKDTMKHVVDTFGGLPRVGCLLVGTKGQLSAGLWNSQCYVRLNDEAKFFGADKHEQAKTVPETIPRSPGHFDEFANACLGEGKVFADFDHGGHLTEIGLAGIVALRMQREIRWDGVAQRVPGEPGADQYIKREPRRKWL